MFKRTSQAAKIFTHLKNNGKITIPEMWGMGIANYTGRISDLRKRGHVIQNECVYNKKKKRIESTYFLRS